MQDELKDRTVCHELEERLFELLEGEPGAPETARLQQHAAQCAECRPLLAHAQAGKAWLNRLEEIEPPANLVHNILARTSLAEEARATASAPAQAGWWKYGWQDRLQNVSGSLRPMLGGILQPRFAMTLAMSFFSISMLLNVGGVKLSSLRRLDLRPRVLSMQASLSYYEMQSKVTRYYDNIRLVYEVQSSLKDTKANSEPASEQRGSKPEEQKQESPKSPDTSKNRKQRPAEQDENYSVMPAMTQMAAWAGQFTPMSDLEEVAQ